MRRVLTPDGSWAPLYQDRATTLYLARLGRIAAPARSLAPVAVFLCYSREPFCFAGHRGVYLSTAAFLGVSSEEELLALLAPRMSLPRPRWRRPRPAFAPSACAGIAAAGDLRFEPTRAALEADLFRYQESLHPKLKIRTAVAKPPPEP